MADSASSNNTPTINSLPEFTSDVYVNITPAELAVFAVYTLKSDGHFAATEEIVSACFRLFPNRFALKNYFYWPDSAQIMLHLNEAKEKGDLKGKPADGFAVKVQGRQTVKRVAKILGVTLPAPEKKIKAPAPLVEAKAEPVPDPSAQPEAEKKVEVPPAAKPVLKKKPAKKKAIAPRKAMPVTPVTKKAPAKKQVVVSKKKKFVAPVAEQKTVKKKTVAPQKKKPIKPLVKKSVKKQAVVKLVGPAAKEKPVKKKAVVTQEKQLVKQKPAKKHAKPIKKTPSKQIAPVKAKELPKPVIVKQATLLVEPRKKEQAKPVVIVPVAKVTVPKKEKPQKQAPVKNAQPAQLTMSLLPIVLEKKEKPAPSATKKVEPKPIKVEKVIAPVAVIQVSKEEKAKAGKVVQVMERSDAYRQYKKSGDKSKISEFDFRSLLLCTMESSPETLARNVNTFKGYANIQNRQDLVVFLNFVETSFSGLLNSSGKKLTKKK